MNKKRLKKLLYNALVWIDEECKDFFIAEIYDEYEWFQNAIGITKQELQKLGIDWLNPKDNN